MQRSPLGAVRPGGVGAHTNGTRTMERRKFVVGLGALAAGTSAAVGSGAFSAALIDDRDANITVSADGDALLALRPGYDLVEDGTVSGDFVGYDSNQLEIDLSGETEDGASSGVNVNSTYQLGAIADDTKSALDSQTAVDDSEVIYGKESDQWLPPKDTSEDPAFGITNNTENAVTAQLNWDGDVPEDVRAALVVDGDQSPLGDGSAAEFGLDLINDQPDSETTFGINSGSTAFVSMIIVVDDGATPEEIEGTLELRAEGAVVQN